MYVRKISVSRILWAHGVRGRLEALAKKEGLEERRALPWDWQEERRGKTLQRHNQGEG